MTRSLARLPVLAATLATVLTAALVPPAAAQAPAAPEGGTRLLLSESAEVTRAPDEIHATLRAEQRGGSAALAQAQLNTVMQRALATARAVPGVTATTGGSWTQRVEETRQWQAGQALVLRGAEAGALLELAGSLQQQGLALGGLSWSLSRPAAQAARQEAGALAIDALRARAVAVAAQLGLRVEGIRELRLDAPDQPGPRPMMAMMARREAAPAPVSAPEDIIISATAAAEILLVK
ncbi:SIMPL domain-containing protein [Roseomonas sp. GC11]|uniref:SIMPL domain-containing protein n=1 Tax=Roseomonas sp. GC11 TaxID=2950546 RepID=UPI00210A34A7|nr:SIMPL domain-containing protein [Roseomonas sp. GC11]MCQ4162210.1 SIMPL domain-containing protein [Roseomonas sp. GC11]